MVGKFHFIFNQFWETNQIRSKDHDRFLAKKYQTSDWSSAKSDFHQFYMWKRLLIYKIRRSSFLILTDVKVDRYNQTTPIITDQQALIPIFLTDIWHRLSHKTGSPLSYHKMCTLVNLLKYLVHMYNLLCVEFL